MALLIHKTIAFETLEESSNNKEYIENLFEEIIQKIIILWRIYRPPRGDRNILTSKAKDLIERYKQSQKSLVLVSDLNLNSLDYTTNNHIQNVFNLVFGNCFYG